MHRYPIDAEPDIPWTRVVACNIVAGAGTTRIDTGAAELGGVCAPGGDCVLRSPSARADAAPATLACARTPSSDPAPTSLPRGIGAVRCVVPAAGLTRVSGP